MGVPAFYRWLSEKYPKIVQDVLEERVKLVNDAGTVRVPFDSTRPNPSGLEVDNLYIDMNGIIHPCSHPEHGPQPSCEEQMYENVCRYVDRLFRAVRPRKLLYLAIDGVAPRAKMNQQRSRRFRSAQEAREHAELEETIRQELLKAGQFVPPVKKPWDSNVITPGTPFMLKLSEYIRFYIRKRMSTDKAWQNITVIFSDASLPGEGEHKIMEHVRLQRAQPGYNPNTVHCLHGLDADLIMLALATHEMHFYILREVVTFGRKSEQVLEQRQLESGFKDAQRQLDEEAGAAAMSLPENSHKPLQRVSIPILREYLASEFASLLTPGALPFPPSLERLIDDVVFLCFFVGNDFLPHLPSLDIRDGALDYLFNVYKRILPSFSGYITNHGGNVNLSNVDVILAEVGSIEDYVFSMKHQNELRENERREQHRERAKKSKELGRKMDDPMLAAAMQDDKKQPPKVLGRAARILEKQQGKQKGEVALGRGHQAKEDLRKDLKANKMVAEANAKAALELKKSLIGGGGGTGADAGATNGKPNDEEMEAVDATTNEVAADASESSNAMEDVEPSAGTKRKAEDVEADTNGVDEEGDRISDLKEQAAEVNKAKVAVEVEGIDAKIEEAEFEDDADDGDANDDDDDEEEEEEIEIPPEVEVDPKLAAVFKEKVKNAKSKQLDNFAKNVEDNVRLHEKGWKDRYYRDKCKADDVSAHGGREHMYRSYVVGLCWVMKYYYDGCASWKWYYPFHYAPFASDLKNIERFQKDCSSFELHEPFKPVEQLMGVLPSDSAHAIPKASRWLMCDEESPIIDFYPEDVPVDPNGKAMPWLWVVLLPFIEEERLLAAMDPTMKEWTKEELACNVRGIDNGYAYISNSSKLLGKVSTVYEDPQKYKTAKLRLTDAQSYASGGFFGSIRLPESNEVFPIDGDVSIEPPSSASKIESSDFDRTFSEPVEPNDAICVSFTEPPKLAHKSVVLPGAKPCKPVLKPEDRRLHRPRLNRGGATIANMGGPKSGASYQAGYGSMNISSYERNLAVQQGRGNQMYQTGTRAWGAMEPAPKRVRQQHPQQPPYPSNPFNQRAPPARPQQNNLPPWQVGGYQQQQQGGYNNQWQQQQPQGQQFNRQGGTFQQQGYGQQQGGYNQGGYQQQRGGYQQPRGGYQQYPPPQQPPQANQHHSFQGYNRTQQPYAQQHGQGGYRPPQQQNQPPSRVNPNVMSSLRSQLANTLQQNRRGGQQGRGQR